MAKANSKNVKKALKKAAAKKPAAKASVIKAKRPVSKKPLPKKAAPKKAAPKKAVKKPAAKPIAKKPAPKKSAAKVSAKKAPQKKKQTVKKQVAKKISKQKSAPKKPIVKKAAAKKPAQKPSQKKAVKKSAPKASVKKAAQKPQVKKPELKKAEKKPAVQKPAAKKSAPQKAAAKPAKIAAPKVDLKEIISKKLEGKTKPAKKIEEAAVETEEFARPSAGIHFTMDDIMDLLSGKAKGEDKTSSASSEKSISKKHTSSSGKSQIVPKRPMSAASIADILGFNPLAESRAKFEEKDVPKKWKKYYNLLMDVKKRFAEVADGIADGVSPSADELTHEQAVQGMDVADIGSKNFERDMAYSLLSNEQAILSEVDAAIERMREGTYGICETTGKPIPETRLTAIPWTRCTIEGQRIKEAEQRRQKAGASRNSYGEIAEDMGDADIYEESDE